MKKLVFTLSLVLGICFLASNCINNDDDYSGGGGGSFIVNIDSFTIEPAAFHQDSIFSFDGIEPLQAPLLEQVFFNCETIRNRYVSHTVLNRVYCSGSMAFARPPDQYYSGIGRLIVTSDKSIYTVDSVIPAGAEIVDLCIFEYRGHWREAKDFLKHVRRGSGLEFFSMRIPVALERPIDQQFTLTFVHDNGDSVSAISPRIVAR